MKDCKTLLPDNTSRTPLTKALECAAAPAYEELIQFLQGVRQNPPDIFLPYILWEYGLLPLLPYLNNDLRKTLDECIPWQTERGTEVGILRALGWINEGNEQPFYEEEVDGAHWNEIQLDPGHIPNDKKVKDIRALVEMSARAITELARLYHGYDIRRLILDEQNQLDYHLLDDYSGVRINGLVRSFGRNHSGLVPAKAFQNVAKLVSRFTVSEVYYPDRWLLDVTPIFDELEYPSPRTARGRLRISQSKPTAKVRQHNHTRLGFASIVLDEKTELDDINAVLDPYMYVVSETFYLDDTRLDDQQAGKHVYVDRFHERKRSGKVVSLQAYKATAAKGRLQAKRVKTGSVSTRSAVNRLHSKQAEKQGQYWLDGVKWKNAKVSWADADYAVSGVLYARTG